MNIKVGFGHSQQEVATKFSEEGKSIAANLGEIQVVTKLVGEIYDGEYVVVPKAEDQKLLTAYKTMQQDVTIEAIPYSEVENNSGGITINIGG